MAAQGFFGPVLQDFSAPNLNILEEQKKYHRFWKQAEVASENLLKEHWNEVETIANSLLENGDLSGKEVVRIIQSTSGEAERNVEPWRLEEFEPYGPHSDDEEDKEGDKDSNGKNPLRRHV